MCYDWRMVGDVVYTLLVVVVGVPLLLWRIGLLMPRLGLWMRARVEPYAPRIARLLVEEDPDGKPRGV
jgi:hypothetical protein